MTEEKSEKPKSQSALRVAFDLHPHESKHRQSRLGCRPNTERRRREGTRRRRAKPGAGPFWLLFWLLKKVTRRKGGTDVSNIQITDIHRLKRVRPTAIAALVGLSAPRVNRVTRRRLSTIAQTPSGKKTAPRLPLPPPTAEIPCRFSGITPANLP